MVGVHPPLRRHASLQPLSREHMAGLVLARNLAHAAGPGARAQVEEAWEGHLREHFDDEERLLMPLLVDPQDRERLRREHDELRGLIGAVLDSRTPGAALCARLSRRLHDHIRWEERVLFETIQTCGADLDALEGDAAAMESRRPAARPRAPARRTGER